MPWMKTHYGSVLTVGCDIPDCDSCLSIESRAGASQLRELAAMMGWRFTADHERAVCDRHDIEKPRQRARRKKNENEANG